MGKKIIINPLTRISGFLEIQVEVDGNRIVDAKSSGLLYRGFEKMLKGRPPLDAIYFTERICGICSTAHSMSSTLALENALDIIPDLNDKMIRDFTHGCEFIQNHLRHFYQYTLPDYVKGPEIHPLYAVPHGDYRLPDKLNKKLADHYMMSFEYSKKAHKMLAIVGGKAPHNHGIFVGGITVNMDISKLTALKSILSSIKDFVVNIMIGDVHIISEYYRDYFNNGRGYGNFMTYGVYDAYDEKELFYVEPKVFVNGRFLPFEEGKISENVYYGWYKSDEVINEPGKEVLEEDVRKENAYSWIKAPRYDGYPMEVGPLARMWLSGIYNRGISTMDRTIARVLEVKKITEILEGLLSRIKLKPATQKRYDIPQEAVGRGLIDTTRGSLGHWINIKDKRINNYDIITPTAWNLSPRDSKGLKGPIEEALIGTFIENIKEPVEIGRIVRSFDPCVSCATHVLSNKNPLLEMRIV